MSPMFETIHHTGFVVRDLAAAENRFAALGYTPRAETVEDDYQDAEIVFLKRAGSGSGEPLIELIRPRSEQSRVYEFAVKSKFRIHHVCYSTGNIEAAVKELTAQKFFQVTPVVEAPAIGGSLICFLFSRETGLFEIVERPPF